MLQDAGLNFEFFTNIFTSQTGKTYYFCYDQGYYHIEGDYFRLIHKATKSQGRAIYCGNDETDQD